VLYKIYTHLFINFYCQTYGGVLLTRNYIICINVLVLFKLSPPRCKVAAVFLSYIITETRVFQPFSSSNDVTFQGWAMQFTLSLKKTVWKHSIMQISRRYLDIKIKQFRYPTRDDNFDLEAISLIEFGLCTFLPSSPILLWFYSVSLGMAGEDRVIPHAHSYLIFLIEVNLS
jgi:hypothetical protein